MSILRDITVKLRDHYCEKIVRRTGNEITLALPTVQGGLAKLNIGLFSNNVIELVTASAVAVALDNSQYLICREIGNTNEEELKIKCKKIYIQIILALTQLGSIFERIKTDSSPEVRKELSDWIKYCDSLNKHAIEMESPRTSGKGLGEYTLDEIMRYQNLTNSEMSEALLLLTYNKSVELSVPPPEAEQNFADRTNIFDRNITYIDESDSKGANIKETGQSKNIQNHDHSQELKEFERYPSARFPDQVCLNDIIPLEIIVKSAKPLSSVDKPYTSIMLKIDGENNKEIPVQVIVECEDDGFEIDGKYYAIINVPVNNQDSKPVVFNVKSKKEGKHTINIRFFQQETYVGEIKLESLVTPTKSQQPISESITEVKEWKSDSAILGNVIPGPDITIFIHERAVSSNLEYDVLVFSSEFPIQEMGPIRFQFNPEDKFYAIFEDIENFSGNPGIIDRKIKAKGMALYDELFPQLLKDLYWERRGNIKSIRVISKEPWIPWEIIKPWRKLENAEIKEDPFLCENYAFSRWIVGKNERIKEQIKNVKVVCPDDTNLTAAIKERQWIEDFGNERKIKISFDSSYEQVIKTLETEKEIDILHFSTHGQNNKENPLLSTIQLQGKVGLRAEEIIGKAMTFGQSHPIVILNACQTGLQNFSLTGIQGWATKFLDAGASTFIGTLWSVNDETALNFVKELYSQLAVGITLGESIKNARVKCKREGNTSWLAYQLYGHPNSIIKFPPNA